jgi:hypothetical protein
VKPKVYLETTIPSLLTAWPSRDLITAADQQSTRDWWETRRHEFELFISPEVLGEAAQGDPEAARLRLAAIAALPVLAATEEVEELTRVILNAGLIPPRATARHPRCGPHRVCVRASDGLFADLELPTYQ